MLSVALLSKRGSVKVDVELAEMLKVEVYSCATIIGEARGGARCWFTH